MIGEETPVRWRGRAAATSNHQHIHTYVQGPKPRHTQHTNTDTHAHTTHTRTHTHTHTHTHAHTHTHTHTELARSTSTDHRYSSTRERTISKKCNTIKGSRVRSTQTERLDHAMHALFRGHSPNLDVSLIMTEPIVSLLVTLMVLWTCRWGMLMTKSQSCSFSSSPNSAIIDSRFTAKRNGTSV